MIFSDRIARVFVDIDAVVNEVFRAMIERMAMGDKNRVGVKNFTWLSVALNRDEEGLLRIAAGGTPKVH